MTKPGQAIHAFISETAHDALRTFCDEGGFSVTAFLTVIGEELAVDEGPYERLIKPARAIDVERRRRDRLSR